MKPQLIDEHGRRFLYVTFLRSGHVERERILEENYACRAMGNWIAKGLEFTVKNHPVQLPSTRLGAVLRQNRQLRVSATRLFSWK